jgi:hypothetical protein
MANGATDALERSLTPARPEQGTQIETLHSEGIDRCLIQTRARNYERSQLNCNVQYNETLTAQ